MLTYAKVANKPRALRSLTGLTPEAFAKPATSLGRAYEAPLKEQKRQRLQPRQRRRGDGSRVRRCVFALNRPLVGPRCFPDRVYQRA